MNAVPIDIRQAGPTTLAITWADGTESTYEVFDLRVKCPCATCVDEFTGEVRLDPATVPADVRPTRIESVGNYAIKITWSDGHDTGIYAYEYLRRLAEET
jgi:ATP-binding protein involved in chromosome partitioning